VEGRKLAPTGQPWAAYQVFALAAGQMFCDDAFKKMMKAKEKKMNFLI
jgi:hypothetical protein